MARLSDSIKIKHKTIRNRIVMAPMVCAFKGENGSVFGREHVEHYEKRAKGGFGLIIVQSTNVSGASEQSGTWGRENRGLLGDIAKTCRDNGAAVMLQLSCADVDINKLMVNEIQRMQSDCKAAASISKQAGFDGVEYHFAHGYTLCKFLDPAYNKRADGFGGSLSNRIRILAEILPGIRKETGEDFIIGVRMGGNIPDAEGAAVTARAFEDAGIDLLDISWGMKAPDTALPEGFIGTPVTYGAVLMKKHARVPVIGVDRIYTPREAEFLLQNDYVDMAAIGRSSLADPDWANKAIAGESVNRCIDCRGGCYWFTEPTRCAAAKKWDRRTQEPSPCDND